MSMMVEIYAGIEMMIQMRPNNEMKEYTSNSYIQPNEGIVLNVYRITSKDECLAVDQVGESQFGTVHYNPNRTLHVISYARMKDTTYRVWRSEEDGIFRVQLQDKGLIYLLTR